MKGHIYAMTQDHSALLAQLDALKSADVGAVFAELIRAGLQTLIEAEATEAIGAGRYERAQERGTHRNEHRPKTVSTTAGDIEAEITKLRAGSFFPSLLERRRRIDKALHAVIMEAYVHGVSTRSVDDLVAAMGVDSGVSKSEVSRICAGLDEVIEAFRTRSLTHTELPYVFCDATFCKVRVGAHVVSQALVPSTAPAKCWVPPSVTASPTSSGASSWRRCAPVAWPGCIWASPMPMPG
jgi:transposase-like protein